MMRVLYSTYACTRFTYGRGQEERLTAVGYKTESRGQSREDLIIYAAGDAEGVKGAIYGLHAGKCACAAFCEEFLSGCCVGLDNVGDLLERRPSIMCT